MTDESTCPRTSPLSLVPSLGSSSPLPGSYALSEVRDSQLALEDLSALWSRISAAEAGRPTGEWARTIQSWLTTGASLHNGFRDALASEG